MSDLDNYLKELLDLGRRIHMHWAHGSGERLELKLAGKLLDTYTEYRRMVENERARPQGVTSGEIG
jgi:hypothetical protein